MTIGNKTIHMKHKLGLALSGGGVKGAAHIGVLKAMMELEVEATCISGASAGSIVGSLYAQGSTIEEMLDFFKKAEFFSISNFSFRKPGLLDTDNFLSLFEEHYKVDSFEQLDKEMHVITTDLIEADSKDFSSGPLIKPLLASCAFPFIFSPVSINDSLFSDGGVINNFPVETVRQKCEYVLGVYVSPLKRVTKDEFSNTFSVLDRVYRISNRYASLKKLALCDWSINPYELQDYGTFNMSKVDEIAEVGYQQAMQIIPEIKRRINE